MIRLVSRDGGLSLEVVGLAPGSVAFIDRDWIPCESGAEVPSLVVPDDASAVQMAAEALARVARDACSAIDSAPPMSVEVTGSGIIALAARELLGRRLSQAASGRRPLAIVETTGDPDVIAATSRRVAALGTLVLAGEPAGRRLTLDLYPDVHVRGLTLVGVEQPRATESFGDPCVQVPAPSNITAGELLPRDAVWYRVTRIDESG